MLTREEIANLLADQNSAAILADILAGDATVAGTLAALEEIKSEALYRATY